jgi:hypothetical protein
MGVRTAPETLKKTPDETTKKAFDFTEGDMDSTETIATIASVSVTPTGPTVSSSAIVGKQVIATIYGGTAGQTYALVATITTSLGQTLQARGLLMVDEA